MNPRTFFMPNTPFRNIANMNMVNPRMINQMGLSPFRGMGILGRIKNSFKLTGFGNFINGANKTLNVVNQTIPLIRQAKPMVNNMKSMIKLARAFGNETVNTNNRSKVDDVVSYQNASFEKERENVLREDNYPNFFI